MPIALHSQKPSWVQDKIMRFIFGVIMGTGCGGGFVHNKKLRVGPNLISGEWGHSILHTNGHACYCQKHGCVETYISGGGLSKILNRPWHSFIR
jgi:fructokinase